VALVLLNRGQEAGIVEDFDIAPSKVGESAQRIVDRAVEESRRRDHAVLGNEHIFLAFAQVEWDLFSQVMRDLELNPHAILQSIEEHLNMVPAFAGRDVRVSPAAKLVFKLALHHASRAGRQVIEAPDLFSAIFEESQGIPVSIIRRHGVEPEMLVSRISTRMRDIELREERLKKRFELPPFLKHFATNLNLLARQDRTPPVFGREHEIQQVLEILCHRERANSVMLIGEPGVGKTAIVEGLARRIEFEPETVPVRLRDCQVVNLQMNSMVAGTMLRGMFEDRIQNVIREIKERPNLILFIDEAHTMVGAGSALGAPSDAANVFKSVLARGEVRIIGATTLSEYKEYIQEDEALARRFRCVTVCEPTIEETRKILFSLRPRLERNYSVRLEDEAIETALELSPRYMRHLHLPDKVIGWLDTAAVRAEIDRRFEVRSEDVVSVISHAASIPEDMVFREVTDRFRDIQERLGERVIGQEQAISAVARRLVLNKGPLKDGFDRPDGVLLFLGPTGVGKTELAKSVAQFLFGDEKKMIRVDMSEYQDGAIAVDKLIGMPRGIVGSERGGVLTNQLRDTPYSVVLLDEVEKASPNLLNLFLQAFDEGWLTDGRGTPGVPERRDRHHDVEPRVGALPQADEPARVRDGPRGRRAGAGRGDARGGTPLHAGVPEPHRRGRALRAADQGGGARDCPPAAGGDHADARPAQPRAERRSRGRGPHRPEGPQPGLWCPLPQARHRRSGEAADQRTLDGRREVSRPCRRRPRRGRHGRPAPAEVGAALAPRLRRLTRCRARHRARG
jgi:ATP-dependent Clp protease ATP-binding subunit ClpC